MVVGFNLNSSKMGLFLGILIILVILIAFLSISKVDVSEDAFESTKKFGLVRSILLETMALGRCTFGGAGRWNNVRSCSCKHTSCNAMGEWDGANWHDSSWEATVVLPTAMVLQCLQRCIGVNICTRVVRTSKT